MKRTLKKILGNAFLSYEELQTVVTDVECTVNSRPITYVYSNEQIEPLTPSHLIAGRRLLSLPQLIEDEEMSNQELESLETFTRRLLYLNKLLHHYWNRFSREYVVSL